MQKIEIIAEPRIVTGGKVKTLRNEGLLPAVVYGPRFDPINIQIPIKEFESIYIKAGESTLVYLKVGDSVYPTIIHDVARDPLSDKFIHADFYKVRLDKKIHADIPLNFIGEAPAVKSYGGILVKNISELEVEGLPQDLPGRIDVDLSRLIELKSQFLVRDLVIPSNITLKNKIEDIIALIQEPISEEELKAQLETPTAAAPEEVEVIKKEKPAEVEAEEEIIQPKP